MTPALAAACLWAIVANLAAMLPSRCNHWPQAMVLIATGIPILGWVTWTNGPFWGIAVFAAGASLLRWPLFHLWRHLRRRAG
ncbi:MAG: DUF2484 family protein [Paracoccaceae bacterium]|nr:MAG: DUF2484 family protein [Paracoccaceae bacterium]